MKIKKQIPGRMKKILLLKAESIDPIRNAIAKLQGRIESESQALIERSVSPLNRLRVPEDQFGGTPELVIVDP